MKSFSFVTLIQGDTTYSVKNLNLNDWTNVSVLGNLRLNVDSGFRCTFVKLISLPCFE